MLKVKIYGRNKATKTSPKEYTHNNTTVNLETNQLTS